MGYKFLKESHLAASNSAQHFLINSKCDKPNLRFEISNLLFAYLGNLGHSNKGNLAVNHPIGPCPVFSGKQQWVQLDFVNHGQASEA